MKNEPIGHVSAEMTTNTEEKKSLIRQDHAIWDLFGLMRQLGVIPS
jgi:hypothetical protein